MVIYLDILLLVNLFVNYFLLLATSLLGHKKAKRWRVLCGALIGSLFALLIFVPNMGILVMLGIKLVIACLLVFITFGMQKVKPFFKTTLIFFAVNFIFAGVMMALWIGLKPAQMFFNNGVVYFGVSPLFLVVATVVSYLVIKGVNWFFNRRVEAKELQKIVIQMQEEKVEMQGFVDTGNRLKDPFSGLAVIVCEFATVSALIPEELHSFFLEPAQAEYQFLDHHPWKTKVRMIPYHTVSTGGIMATFEPDLCYRLENGKKEILEILVGVTPVKLSDGEYQAVLSANIA